MSVGTTIMDTLDAICLRWYEVVPYVGQERQSKYSIGYQYKRGIPGHAWPQEVHYTMKQRELIKETGMIDDLRKWNSIRTTKLHKQQTMRIKWILLENNRDHQRITEDMALNLLVQRDTVFFFFLEAQSKSLDLVLSNDIKFTPWYQGYSRVSSSAL